MFPNDDPSDFIESRNKAIRELLENPRKRLQEDEDICDEDTYVIIVLGHKINLTPLFMKFND